jgi:hypothetical protein
MLLLHLFYPIYPKEQIQERARNDLIRLLNSHSEYVDFNLFCEFCAKLAFLWLEETGANSSLAFFNMIYNRTTRKKIVQHGTRMQIEY